MEAHICIIQLIIFNIPDIKTAVPGPIAIQKSGVGKCAEPEPKSCP